MTHTFLKFAASALAISVGTSAFAQDAYSEINTLTCSEFMEMDATGQRTLGLQLKSFPGTDIDPGADTSATVTVDQSSAGTDVIPTADSGGTVVGETDPTVEVQPNSGDATEVLNVPTAMGDMADDEVVPFILTACEGQPDTLAITALRTN